MRYERRKACRGFTLVELLVVVAIFGLVVSAMYGVFESNRRSSFKQEAVVEVQQNLRAAMTQIQRDILMAGFLLPFNLPPVETAGASAITLQTASAQGIGARIEGQFNTAVPSEPITQFDTVAAQNEKIQLGMQEMVDLFAANQYVRIIRPGDFGQPVDAVLQVLSTDRANSSIVITDINGVGTIRKGYMIVRVPGAGAAHPNTIAYTFDAANNRLMRNATGTGNQVFAENITGLDFVYILDDGTEVTSLPANDPLLANIRAVRVTLSGQTDPRMAGYTGITNRSLTNVVALRNR